MVSIGIGIGIGIGIDSRGVLHLVSINRATSLAQFLDLELDPDPDPDSNPNADYPSLTNGYVSHFEKLSGTVSKDRLPAQGTDCFIDQISTICIIVFQAVILGALSVGDILRTGRMRGET